MRIKKLSLILMLFGGLSVPAAAVPVQWKIADGGNGHYYEAILVGDQAITWVEADAAATAAGAYLATLTSSAENAFVYDLVNGDSAFWFSDGAGNGIGPWLGGIQTECSPPAPNCGWGWVTGEPWGGYTNWASGEPNDWLGQIEDALAFHGKGMLMGPQWNDRGRDGGKANGYVIEFVPEPGMLLLLLSGGLALLRSRRLRRNP